MEITDVRLTLIRPGVSTALVATAHIVFDGVFMVREVRILKVANPPRRLVVMPDWTVKSKCRDCGKKNSIAAQFCNWCGVRLTPDLDQRAKADVAHPLTPDFREYLTSTVLEALDAELAKQRAVS